MLSDSPCRPTIAVRDKGRAIEFLKAGTEDYDLEPGRTERMRILDVDGVLIVMRILEPAGRDAAARADLHQILDSIRIQPLS